jgi:tetratricopeptide (TPR) repeat protein
MSVRASGNRRPALWTCAAIFLATAAAYVPAIRGGFIWDDDAHVTRPALRSLHGLWRIWFEVGATQQYYPILHSAFWLEHWLWGDSALGYHLLNVLLHATAACLFVAVLRRLAVPGAWVAGLVFALHPVCVESVAWISEQKNTLSAVLYLLSAWAYLRWREPAGPASARWTGATAQRASASRNEGRALVPRPGLYVLATVLFVLAVLTKSVTATLPAALLVVAWWRRGRLAWREDVAPLLFWFALGAASGLFTAWVEWNYVGAHGNDFHLKSVERCLLAGRAVWFYLGKLVWPAKLIFIYPRWEVDGRVWWQHVFPAAALALMGALGWIARAGRRGPLAAFLYYCGTLFPALGFFNVFPFVFSYVADHFQYLASMGVIACLSSLAAPGRPNGHTRPPSAPGETWRLLRVSAAVAVMGVLGALTWRQCAIYRDAQTLYAATLKQNPQCWLAKNNLGALLTKQGRLAEAIALLEESLRLEPLNPEAHYNLGLALSKSGRFREAAVRFETALQLMPEHAEAHNNLANLLAKQPGRKAEAIAHYEAALRLRPDFAEAHNNLALLLAGDPGRQAEAIAHYEEALRLKPDYAEAHNNLAGLLATEPDRQADAIAHYEAALRLRPDFAEAHNNLGFLLASLPGRQADAIVHYEIALRLMPNSSVMHFNLARVLEAMPDRQGEAALHYEAALKIDPDLAPAREALQRLQPNDR